MNPMGLVKAFLNGELLSWVARPIARRFGYLARSYRRHYYPGLALIFIVAIAVNGVWQTLQSEVKSQSLDLAIRARLSSPVPDKKIVILDIDERSLALLAPEHGRWPWPRSVLAEALATLNDAGARAIVFNIMMSDADKTNVQADALFNEIAAASGNAVFPLIRLNPKNDAQSEVEAKMLPGARIENPEAGKAHIAVLFPIFPGTHDKLGVNNLKIDKDGVVRRYAVWWQEQGFKLPSLPLRAAKLGNVKNIEQTPDEIILNWRNKRGDYQRISFADYYLAANGKSAFALDVFKGATVIVGISAPGIATTKGTASSPLMDDNVILATAIDDITNDTHLRILPKWLIALFSSAIVLALALAFAKGIEDKYINRWFVLAQSSLVAVTIFYASYTVYLVDLSECFFFALFYFTIAKLHALIDRNASRGMLSYIEINLDPQNVDRFVIFGFDKKGIAQSTVGNTKDALERHFSVRRVFHIDNAFGSDNLLGDACKDLHFFIVFCKADDLSGATPGTGDDGFPFGEIAVAAGLRGVSDIRQISPTLANTREDLEHEVGRALLGVSNRLINPQQD